MGRAALALLAAAALLAVAACGGRDGDGAASGELQDVSSVAVVKDAFEADAGTPRLVLLLSPT